MKKHVFINLGSSWYIEEYRTNAALNYCPIAFEKNQKKPAKHYLTGLSILNIMMILIQGEAVPFLP
ncbi:MAG: hypothetical protein BRD49_05325 [Bacteroidetes bacterium SW_10_40_5]|nr:MAG: hypothetical protein BRD49_05325 [Bacteroidetes bacterium SW_10_40_5]